jgi:hypothetical protein
MRKCVFRTYKGNKQISGGIEIEEIDGYLWVDAVFHQWSANCQNALVETSDGKVYNIPLEEIIFKNPVILKDHSKRTTG